MFVPVERPPHRTNRQTGTLSIETDLGPQAGHLEFSKGVAEPLHGSFSNLKALARAGSCGHFQADVELLTPLLAPVHLQDHRSPDTSAVIRHSQPLEEPLSRRYKHGDCTRASGKCKPQGFMEMSSGLWSSFLSYLHFRLRLHLSFGELYFPGPTTIGLSSVKMVTS